MLRDALASGDFVVTAELGAPLNPDPELVRQKARAFAGIVHAANVTDNQAATVKLSPLACSVWTPRRGSTRPAADDPGPQRDGAPVRPPRRVGARRETVLALGRPAEGRAVRGDREARLGPRLVGLMRLMPGSTKDGSPPARR